MQDQLRIALDDAVIHLNAASLPAHRYDIPACIEYELFLDMEATNVSNIYCIEAYLGPSHGKPDYETYALAQLFHPGYLNLALVTLIERHKNDGRPSTEPSTYNITLDNKFSRTFLPIMHTAFNDLDPTGQRRGLLVQSYHARLTLADLVQAGIMTVELIARFKRDGQLAQIAVDFDDPLITLIANALRPFLGLVGDIHYLPRTRIISKLKIPIRGTNEHYYCIANNSTALENGITIALKYLRKHSRNFLVERKANSE